MNWRREEYDAGYQGGLFTKVGYDMDGFGEFLDEVVDEALDAAAQSAGAISETNYIQWVQRSLNRLRGAGLSVDGNDSTKYREAVRDFQQSRGLKGDGKVGVNTQDALIKANEKNPAYMFWVQEALLRAVAGADLVPTGVKDETTRTYLRGFQAYHGLKDVGYVNPHTELALIEASGKTTPEIRQDPIPSKPVSPGPRSSNGLTQIYELARRAESLGVPRGFANYGLIHGYGESGGNHLVGLGIPERFPSWARPTLSARQSVQYNESRAAERGYDKNLKHYGVSPHPRREWVFGSGGWFGFLPSTGLAAWRGTNLIASGGVYPYMVFEPWPSIVMLADYVRRVIRLPHFKNLPSPEKNWLAIRRAAAGLSFIGDYQQRKARSRAVRERAERHAQKVNVPVGFLRQPVPADWPSYPGAVALLRAG